nr:hypothetical protein [Marinitoga lauensis]
MDHSHHMKDEQPKNGNHSAHEHHEHHGHQEHEHEHHDHGHEHHNHHDHHAHMVKDFKKRFWISLIFTIPVLVLSPLVQKLLGLRNY